MKKVILGLGFVLSAAVATTASATPIWSCTVSASLVNNSQDIILAEKISYVGKARVNCVSPIMGVRKYRAKVRISGIAIGPAIRGEELSKTGTLNMKVGLSDPYGLFGQYNVDLGASANLLVTKLTGSTGLEVTNNHEIITAEVALTGVMQNGLGARVNLTKMKLSPL